MTCSIGVAFWRQIIGLGNVVANTLEALGCDVKRFLVTEPLPPNIDLLFAYGPEGSLRPLAQKLLYLPPAQRPQLVLLHAEQFPNPNLTLMQRRLGGEVRSAVDRLVRWPFGDPLPAALDKWAWRALRYRYYGDLYWLRRNGIAPKLVIPSEVTAAFWRERGFETLAIRGFCLPDSAEMGTNLHLARDIPVLWLGKPGSKRRADLLQRIRRELAELNIPLMVIDGIENPYVFGEARTKLLNRTKVVLNLLREPWDENFGRFYLAALNHALIATEPMLDHNPSFLDGVHIVAPPISQLAAEIAHYVEDDDARTRITNRCHQLVTTKLTLENSMRQMLAWLDGDTMSDAKRSPAVANGDFRLTTDV